MPSPIKPNLPVTSISELQSRIDRMATALQNSKGLDGSVEFRELEQQVKASRDPQLTSLFEHLRDRFERHARPMINPDETVMSHRSVDLSLMKPDEVAAMAAALDRAKGRVKDFDTDFDGRISWNEGRASLDPRNDANDIANVAVRDLRGPVEQELAAWTRALLQVESSIAARGTADRRITSAVERHVKTPEAAEAVRWAYREKLILGHSGSPREISGELHGAERSLLSKIPLFGGLMTMGKHLDDGEVKAFLGTDDLGAYAAEKRAAVEAKSGGYEKWLSGADIAGADMLQDPLFKANRPIGEGS